MSLLLSLLLIPIVRPQTPQWDLSQKVTYATVAKSAKRVCEDLEKLTHVPLDAERQTATEVLVIDVKDVPLKTLLDKIAIASSAKWETAETRMKLTRPTEVARQQAQEEIAFYAAKIEKSMKAAADKAAKAVPYDSQSAIQYSQQYNALSEQLGGNPGREVFDQMRALDRNSPIGRLADRLMPCLDAKRLAAMRQDESVVFSTAPNRLQFPFGPSAAAAVQQFSKDWTMWADAAATIETPQRRMSSFVDGLKSSKRPAKVVSVCKWAQMRTAISVQLYAISADGSILAETDANLAVDDMMDSLSSSANKLGKPTAEVPGTGFTFSPLAQAWTSRVRELMEPIPGAKKADQAALDRWAMNPTENDPLSLHPSEAIMAVAKSKSLNLVADLTDQSILISILAAAGMTKTSSEYSDLLQKSSGMVFDTDGKWLVAKPVLPARATRERFDRPSLQLLIKAIKGKGYLSLDEMASFCYSNDPNAMSQLSLMGFLIMTGDMNAVYPLMEYFGVLGFYGSLLPAQRTALLSGSPLAYRDMVAPQRARFERLIYGGSERGISSGYTTDELGLSSASRIATEAFPSGPPSDSSVSVNVRTAAIAQSDDRNKQGLDPETMAMYIMSKERPEIFGGRIQELSKGYRLGTQTTYDFLFDHQNKMLGSCHIAVSQVDQRQTPVPYDKLPKSFLDEVQKALQQQRKAYENVPPPVDNQELKKKV